MIAGRTKAGWFPENGPLVKVAAVICITLLVLACPPGILAENNLQLNPSLAAAALGPSAVEWTALPFDNPTVSLYSSIGNLVPKGNGRIEVLLSAGADRLPDIGINVYQAVTNIVGEWSTTGSGETILTDESGLAVIDVEPGEYALRLDEYFGRVYGTYGVNVKSNDYGGTAYGRETADTSMIPVTVHKGEVVLIEIRLAKLVVGVTSGDGKSVLPGQGVYVYPETSDIAGNPIALPGYGNTGYETSAEGTSIWYIGMGSYTVRVYNYPHADTYVYHVFVAPGEEKQIITTGY